MLSCGVVLLCAVQKQAAADLGQAGSAAAAAHTTRTTARPRACAPIGPGLRSVCVLLLLLCACVCARVVRNGHIKRITDGDIQSSVLELMGTNVSTNYITCPADPKATLGIKLPFLVMIIKNVKKYFTFEVQVLDDKNVRRRFRASNYQSSHASQALHLHHAHAPGRGLEPDPVQPQSDFTRRAYGTNYIETLRVQLHANCRVRRIYFSGQAVQRGGAAA